MSAKRIVATSAAPAAIGPYSQAVVHNGLVYVSGQIPLNPATGQVVAGDVAAQTAQVMDNLRAILEASGASLDSVLKTTVFLADLGEFAAMNEVYGRYFAANPPARATVQAARLPRDARLEIDCVAAVAG
ncbi:MAG: RidA family protein [Bryobacterales bacterium]|nr:RidA family protein [Bryobacterales bacterium]